MSDGGPGGAGVATFLRVWRFDVVPEHEREFLAANGPDGEWARLFSRAEGYLGTILEPVIGVPHAYRTTDRWRSAEDFARFLARFGDAYRALDERYEPWTTVETMEFEGLSPDEPPGR